MPDPLKQSVSASQAAALFNRPKPRRMPTEPEAFWDWLLERAIPEPNSGCLIWLRALSAQGYAIASRTPGFSGLVHRRAHEILVRGGEKLPPKLDPDHKCRVRCCVNPAHLEPISRGENVRRGIGLGSRWRLTRCSRGHEFTPENTYHPPGHPEWRGCRTCRKLMKKAWDQRNARC
jgi:HNH endonuclease